jgi:hypothetical protein
MLSMMAKYCIDVPSKQKMYKPFFIIFLSICYSLDKKKNHNIDVRYLRLILIDINCHQEQKHILSYKAHAVV